MAAVSIVLLSAEPGLGQNVPIPCSAFARTAHGDWKVLAPVMLYIDGRPLGPMVGSTLPAESIPNSIKVSEALDFLRKKAVESDPEKQGVKIVVKPGTMMFEIAGVNEATAREACRLADNKLGIRTRFVVRQGAH